MRSERPAACFGREHGRNKGEFNALELWLGLISPMSLIRKEIRARGQAWSLVIAPRTGPVAPGTL
jgi:hypothetical protein